MVDMVSQFVRQHGFNLISAELANQGIAQDDAPGIAQPSQRGISLLGAARHIHLKHTPHFCARLFSQGYQPFRQVSMLLVQGGELVENRHQ